MKILKQDLQIVIDGPVGSGKSVGAQLLAQRLKIFYLNTGATFRAVAYLAQQNGINYKEKRLLRLLRESQLDIKMGDRGSCRIILKGKDITDNLFNEEMDYGSSVVAVSQDIRDILTKKWRQMAYGKPIVMEGRDIIKVLPKADLKIFMTADTKIRIRRIWKKYGDRKTFKEIEKQIEKRDYQDSHRKINPLKHTRDYWLLNTSSLTVEEEIQLIIKKLKEMELVA